MINFFLVFSFVFGAIIGSFLNCLIWRFYKEESVLGRSYCPKCRKKISWYDNIPIFSFIILRGRCRFCQGKISWQYPLVEAGVGILFALSFLVELKRAGYGLSSASDFLILNSFARYSLGEGGLFIIHVLRDWFLIAVMTFVFVYDLRWYLILDIIVLPACIVAFAANLYLGVNWLNLLFSAIIGSSFFLLQYVVSKGKWIGAGDIRLGLLMGLALGWPLILLGIFLGYLLGAFVGILLILNKKKEWKSEVPLGVFLSVSTIIALFWGKSIISWYLNFF